MPLFDEQGARTVVAAWKEWLEAQPLGEVLPKEELKAAARRLADPAAERDVAGRIERAFDRALERLRGLDRSTADLLGPDWTERAIDAVGDLEPDEAAVRSFFEERAVGDLLGSVLYDGISEFVKKANQVSEMLPGVAAAKKLAGGFLGAIGGGIAGQLAGAAREELEKRIEQQVRAFLKGFGRIAVERAVRFATAPQNKKLFREMRRNLARKALERPLRDAVAGLTGERAADLRRRLVEAARRALEEERASGKIQARIDEWAAGRGKETLAAAAGRLLGGVLPTEDVARVLAPGLARFEPDAAAKVAIKTAAVRLG